MLITERRHQNSAPFEQSLLCLGLSLPGSATPGCRQEKPAQKELAKEEGEVDRAVAMKASVKAKLAKLAKHAMLAKLAMVDKFDGKTDKIVSKCASCALGMDGKSEHALGVSGYTFHFCSEYCKTRFEQNTTKAILALQIPED